MHLQSASLVNAALEVLAILGAADPVLGREQPDERDARVPASRSNSMSDTPAASIPV
jgi:hypothetical protein